LPPKIHKLPEIMIFFANLTCYRPCLPLSLSHASHARCRLGPICHRPIGAHAQPRRLHPGRHCPALAPPPRPLPPGGPRSTPSQPSMLSAAAWPGSLGRSSGRPLMPPASLGRHPTPRLCRRWPAHTTAPRPLLPVKHHF
jgi:hypothetical protein